jgi:hypothetical protein
VTEEEVRVTDTSTDAGTPAGEPAHQSTQHTNESE